MDAYWYYKYKQEEPHRLMVTFSPDHTSGCPLPTSLLNDLTAHSKAFPTDMKATIADSVDGSSISVDSVDGDVGYGYGNGYLGLSDEDVDQYGSSVMGTSAAGSSRDNPVDLIDDEDSFAGVENPASDLSMDATALVDDSPSVSSMPEPYRIHTLFNPQDESIFDNSLDTSGDCSDMDSISSGGFPSPDCGDSQDEAPSDNYLDDSDNLSGVDSSPSFDSPLINTPDEAIPDNVSSASSVTLASDTTSHQEMNDIRAERMAANKAHWEITRNLIDEASLLTIQNNTLKKMEGYYSQLCKAAFEGQFKCSTDWSDRERLVDEAVTCLTSAASLIIENSGPDDVIREVVPLIHLAVQGNLKRGATGGGLLAAVTETRGRMKSIREKKRLEEEEKGVPGGKKRPASDEQVQRAAKVCRCSGYAWEERKTPEQVEDEQVSLLCLREMRAKEDSDDEDVFEDALEM